MLRSIDAIFKFMARVRAVRERLHARLLMLAALILVNLFLTSSAHAEPGLSPIALRVWDLFLSPAPKYSEPPLAFDAYSAVAIYEQKVAVQELEDLPEVREARIRGRVLRAEVIRQVVAEDRAIHRSFAERFQAGATEWVDRSFAADGAANLYAVQIAVAASMGVRDLDYFSKPENYSDRWTWQKKVTAELLREANENKDRVSPDALAKWKEQTFATLHYQLSEAAKILVREDLRSDDIFLGRLDANHGEMQPLTEQLLDSGKLTYRQDAPVIYSEDDTNHELPIYTPWFIEIDGTNYFLYSALIHEDIAEDGSSFAYALGRKSLEYNNSLSLLTLNSVAKAIDISLQIDKIDQFARAVFFLKTLPNQLSKNQFKLMVAKFVAELKAQTIDEAELYRHLACQGQYPLWELMSDLRWFGYSKSNRYWLDRHLEAVEKNLPSWDLSMPNRQIQFALKHSPEPHQKVTPKNQDYQIPPPIDDFTLRYAISVKGPTNMPKLFRMNSPFDTGGAWEKVKPIKVRGSIRAESLEPLSARDKLLMISTPIGYELSALSLKPNGRPLKWGKDFCVYRSQESKGYVAELAAPKDCHITAEYTQSTSVPTDLPEVQSERLNEIAADLEKAGDLHISRQLRSLNHASPSMLANAVSENTLYSFFPADARVLASGYFSEFARFLDPHGAFCVQCMQANQILLKILRMAYRDEPRLSFQIGTFLLRHGEHLTLPPHAAVEIFWDGHLVLTLDATPDNHDERAPEAFTLRKLQVAKTFSEDASLLSKLREQLLNRIPKSDQRILPPDAPFFSILQTVANVAKLDLLASDERRAALLAELQAEAKALEAWSDTSVSESKASAQSLRVFHSVHRAGLDELMARAADFVEHEIFSCAGLLHSPR